MSGLLRGRWRRTGGRSPKGEHLIVECCGRSRRLAPVLLPAAQQP